jgi:hypothetical protein
VVEEYDPKAESRQLSESVRGAVVGTGLAQVGAVGLGALVIAAASTVAVDVTGILAASFVALLGLGILPAKRRRAQAEFRARSDALRERLVATLREQFDGELERSLARIREAVAPYTRFVRAERDKARALHEELAETATRLRQLRVGVERSLSADARGELAPAAAAATPLLLGEGEEGNPAIDGGG